MKKRGILILLLILITGCTDVSEDTTDVIDGITVDKAVGGVIICDANYPCGNADDICPEEFGAECKVNDPDCKG